jgi:hypothetical protein
LNQILFTIKEIFMYDEVPSPNRYSPLNPIETWIKALTQPREESYLEIVNDPGASMGKAILWLAGAGFLGGLFTGLVNWIFGVSPLSQFARFGDFDIPVARGGFMSVITNSFGGAFGTVIGALIFTGLVQVVAKMLGGTGTFDKLFYGFAAFQAPLGLVSTAVSVIPIVRCLSVLISIYGIVLCVIANQAVHEYDTGKAVISTLAPVVVIGLFCCCIIAVFGTAISALLGPSIENIFDNIQSSLVP